MSQTSPTPSGAQVADRPETWEMVVVHRVFRREFGALPGLVRAVPAGNVRRAAVVLAHLRELAEVLHHHHTAEDELVWPLLLERVGLDRPLVLRMEEQHERVGALLDRARCQAALCGPVSRSRISRRTWSRRPARSAWGVLSGASPCACR